MGEGSLGYERGRVYLSGGRSHPILGPGDKWYPRLRIEMVDRDVVARSAFLLGEKPYQTRKGTWLSARVGRPMITYLTMTRPYLTGMKGVEADYIIEHGSPVIRGVVELFISRFR